jgi:uncharacterized CHY-type Zn-finger protein
MDGGRCWDEEFLSQDTLEKTEKGQINTTLILLSVNDNLISVNQMATCFGCDYCDYSHHQANV